MKKIELYKNDYGSYTLIISDDGKAVVFENKISFKRAIKIIRQYEERRD